MSKEELERLQDAVTDKEQEAFNPTPRILAEIALQLQALNENMRESNRLLDRIDVATRFGNDMFT